MKSKDITITEEAAAYLHTFLSGETHGKALRLGVETSGCSGLSYCVEPATDIQAQDHIFHVQGLSLVVDEKSSPYLLGTEIDCIQVGLNKQLKFNNPNVKSECGCGESFSVIK